MLTLDAALARWRSAIRSGRPSASADAQPAGGSQRLVPRAMPTAVPMPFAGSITGAPVHADARTDASVAHLFVAPATPGAQTAPVVQTSNAAGSQGCASGRTGGGARSIVFRVP